MVFVTVNCPVCGESCVVDHGRSWLPCKDLIRCGCKTEYIVQLTLAENKTDAVAEIIEVDTSKTTEDIAETRAAS